MTIEERLAQLEHDVQEMGVTIDLLARRVTRLDNSGVTPLPAGQTYHCYCGTSFLTWEAWNAHKVGCNAGGQVSSRVLNLGGTEAGVVRSQAEVFPPERPADG